MSNSEQSQHLLNAQQTPRGLGADTGNAGHSGDRLIRHGQHQLNSSAVTLGAAALGGLVIGVAMGRASTGRRAGSMFTELLGRATSAFAATLATQLIALLVTKRT